MDAATLYEFVLGIHVFFAIVTYRTLLSQEKIGAILSIITTSCCSCVFKVLEKKNQTTNTTSLFLLKNIRRHQRLITYNMEGREV